MPQRPEIIVVPRTQPCVVIERKVIARVEHTPVLPTPVETMQEPKPCVIVSPCSEAGSGDSSNDTVVLLAGATIHGDRAVIVENDVISHPDTSNPAHASAVIGIAEQSGSIGAFIRVRKRGQMQIAGASFEPGFVWCGASGVLTQNPVGIGWLLPVGRALDATTIDVSVEPPILRSI